MKLKYKIFASLVLMAGCALGLSSCADDEDALQPSSVGDNPYRPDPNATDPETVLRRNFYDDHNFYILFNDLLRQRYAGKDLQGNDVYEPEYIDLAYTITSYSENSPKYEILTGQEEKEKAVEIIENYVLPHIDGVKLKPFAMFPVKSLLTYRRDPNGGWSYDYYPAIVYSNIRYFVISVGDFIGEEDETAIEAAVRGGMKSWVESMLDKYSEALDPFYEISDEYRGERISDYYPEWDRSDMSIIYELGFLSYFEDWYGYIEDDEFLSYSSYCFDDFFDLAMDYSEDEVIEMYGQYDLIMQKYYLMVEYIESCGYKF